MNSHLRFIQIILATHSLLFVSLVEHAHAETIIIDDDNANNGSGVFSVLPGGPWDTAGLPDFVGQWGADYRWKVTDDPAGVVEWRPTILVGGDYEVAVWFRSTGAGRPNNALYTVDYDGGSQAVVVSQQVSGSRWVALGTFPFAAGNSGRVTLTSQAQAGKNIVADAVRFKRVGSDGPSQSAGMRVSRIPFSPFPEPEFFIDTANCMATKAPAAAPQLIWIVSLYWSAGDIGINFPNPTGQSYPFMNFSSIDRNEAHLDAFDAAGIQVWLQVEPGDANIEDLVDIVLTKYGHHPCVIGFGVDVEWHNPTAVGNGRAVTDVEAQTWLARIKSYDPSYRLFLKHYLQSKMPPNLRSDIVFVNDSQDFPSLNSMVNEFASWGANFSPAESAFQFGYPNDRPWWSQYADPAGTITGALDAAIPSATSFFWVDFTIEEIVPVGDPPVITTQPVDVDVYLGRTIEMSVSASGNGDLAFAWEKNGVPLVEGGCCVGVDSANLSVTATDFQVAGAYRCVVHSGCGDTISNEVALTVLTPGDFDGDGDVDHGDMVDFAFCAQGPAVTYAPGDFCLKGDANIDNVVDLFDWGHVQRWFTLQ